MDREIHQVLEFWFGALTDEGLPAEPMDKLWFGASSLTDSAIAQRFGGLHQRAVQGELAHWQDTPAGRLALIILIDQFSRNLFRGEGQAFAWDGIALALCKTGIEQGVDRMLPLAHKLFFYMPLQHSEALEDQRLGEAMLERLLTGLEGAPRQKVADTLRFQRLHLEIIMRFGRFPHRNAVLGRQPSEEEEAYLADGAPRFGQ
ncbi:DUF924 family protein [Ferrimonas balearica]|uniref:DUF924 family protein n=1 Tax=Ferrimonas balearica TaxID=44012 RepID=UPI001C55EDF9|nr:DUF924 family protein [Ferrimonas balearica]MBW3139864.1 DUF924 domain-containing protein [Ferrimonas balearica]MBY6107030.1 DUF924 domain-containing protein [Ferrimonas balearica]MBY6224414.1 DUF924 domain-containing protein [Ferrimonas balearica]